MMTGCLMYINVRAQNNQSVGSGTLTVNANTNKNRILFTVETNMYPTANGIMTKVSGSGSIILNETESGYLFHENGIYFVILDDYSIAENDVITVKGEFEASDGFNINIEETQFVYNSASAPCWGIVTTDSDVTLVESGTLAVNANTNKNRIMFGVEASTRPTVTGIMTKVSGSGSINLNETERGYLFHENGTYFIILDDYPITNNDVVTIKGKFEASDGFIINIRETTFKCLNILSTGTSCWQIKTDYTESNVNEIYSQATKYANAEHGWHFYLGLSEKSDNIAYDSRLLGFEYSINGGERKELTAFYAEYGDGSLFFIMPELPEHLTENTTLTIFSGQANITDQYYGIHLISETVLYGNQYGWSTERFIVQTTYTETTVINIDSSATKYVSATQGWHFYLDLSDKSEDIALDSAIAGFEYSINDGVKKTSTVFYASHHDGSLFFVVSELPEKITENTKLTIFSGQAITEDDYYGLSLTSDVILYGNRYGWSLENYLAPPETGVWGDINGDGETNLFDLVYLKKNLAGLVTVNTQAMVTKSDYIVDEDDITSLMKILITSYNNNNRPLGIPMYEDNKQIEMAAYMGPRKAGMTWYVNGVSQGKHSVDFINDFEFKRYKAAGFTYLIAEQDAAYGSDNLATYMRLAKDNDLGVVLLDNYMTSLLRAEEVPTDTSVIEARTAEMKATYGDTFRGWMLADEPSILNLKNYTQIASAIRKVNPTNFLMTAFLPLHASVTSHTTDEDILSKLASGESLTLKEKNVAYMEYVNSYGKLFGEFNYDLYPLQGGTTVRGDWLRNLSLVAQGGKENRYLTGITLQSHGYMKTDNDGNPAEIYRAPTAEDDIGFQAYTALAYGIKKLNYYTYWGHYLQGSTGYMSQTMVQYPEGDGTQSVTTPIYEAVRMVNSEIKKFDHVLMNYAWEGTITLGNANDYSESAYTNNRVTSCSATENTSVVIGCMRDAIGYDGYLIANASNPANDITTEVTVRFKDATRAVVYIDGEQTIVTLNGGTYTVAVPSGEGIFVIPIV